MEKILKSIPRGIIKEDDLFNFIEDFPALLWRIDIIQNKIEYLNSHQIEGLGPESGLILKNIDFSHKLILKEDAHLLSQFMQAVRRGETAATIFRIKNGKGRIIWIKVTGTVNRKNPRYYLGYMLDVTDTVGIVQDILENETGADVMIEQIDHPVILIDTYDKTILAHNKAAKELFGHPAEDFSKLNFYNLFHPRAKAYINQIYDETFFKNYWHGNLTFQRMKKPPFRGSVVIRKIYFRGIRVFQLSIYDVVVEEKSFQKSPVLSEKNQGFHDPVRENYVAQLTSRLKHESDMSNILKALLDNQYGHMNFDFIIYSDVYKKKNKVIVYTASKFPSSVKQGEVFSYEGTIAQNADRYNMDHLIVEDTFSSIKAIDWALFIPLGLRSYFAKPFFNRRVMRTVLVLCSTQKNMFFDKHVSDYALLYTPFLLGLTNWRKAGRNKKK